MNHPLEKRLKIIFHDPSLLKRALTHRSCLNEQKGLTESNERLEFLGDAILEFLVSRFLYQQFPNAAEGKLTSLRSKLVCDHCLSKIAIKLEIGQCLLLSRGEDESGGRTNHSLLANAFEALVGAVYLDQGLPAVKQLLNDYLFPAIEEAKSRQDYKSIFQERTQKKFRITPIYQTLQASGPDHDKNFMVGVFLDKKLWGKGGAGSKQAAEQQAAKKALEKLTAF